MLLQVDGLLFQVEQITPAGSLTRTKNPEPKVRIELTPRTYHVRALTSRATWAVALNLSAVAKILGRFLKEINDFFDSAAGLIVPCEKAEGKAHHWASP